MATGLVVGENIEPKWSTRLGLFDLRRATADFAAPKARRAYQQLLWPEAVGANVISCPDGWVPSNV